MSRTHFKEEQKLSQFRIYLILILIVSIFLVFIGIAFYEDNLNTADNENSVKSLLTAALFVLPVLILITIVKLKMWLIVEIRDEGIFYKYVPIIKKFRQIPFEDIERYEIRKYHPLIEYRGWGIRDRGLRKKRKKWGIAYTAKGTTGLQLYLKNSKKILIGTQRKDAIKFAMEKVMKELSIKNHKAK